MIESTAPKLVGEPVSNLTNVNGEFILYNVPEGDQLIRMSKGGIIYFEKYITIGDGQVVDMGVLYLPIP